MGKTLKQLIGKRLQRIRKVRLYTQEKPSEKVGITAKHLSDLECGTKNPTLDVFIKLSDALEVELSEIFTVGHEIGNPQKMRQNINELLENAEGEKLKIATKLIKSILR